jgi:putative tricarboxylic transport membrane protein
METGDRKTTGSELWGGLVWLAFGLWVTWEGYKIGLGELHEPGSGFAVFWLGIIATVLAVAVVVSAIANPSPSVSSLWRNTRWQKVLLVIALLLVFGFFFEKIGFIPCAFILLIVLMRVIDPVPWPQALIVSVGSVLCVWFLLAKFLKIQLPAGLLAPLLG